MNAFLIHIASSIAIFTTMGGFSDDFATTADPEEGRATNFIAPGAQARGFTLFTPEFSFGALHGDEYIEAEGFNFPEGGFAFTEGEFNFPEGGFAFIEDEFNFPEGGLSFNHSDFIDGHAFGGLFSNSFAFAI